MSERGEVEVMLPLERTPSQTEHLELMRVAFAEARKLVGTVGGRVLGVAKVARCEDLFTGHPAMRVTFAVDAPESTWQS